MIPKRFFLLFILVLLTACGQSTTTPQNNPGETPKDNSATLKTLADTYSFSQGALSLVGKDKGVLVNDTLPQTFDLTVTTNPTHGVLELNPDGSFSYQHDGSAEGQDGFSYTVSASGETSTATVILTITAKSPNAPTANADAFTLDEGATLTVNVVDGVLKNDLNPLASSLSATVVETPKHGNLTLNTDGSFTYTHDNSETTEDSFIYSISNAEATAQATVILTIAPVDEAPTANADTYTVDEGATLTVNVADGLLKNDTNPLASSLSANVLEAPKHGNLTLNTDGSFTYAHDDSDTTEDSFIYSLSNGQETALAKVILSINAIMDTPTANEDAYTLVEGETLTVNVPDGVLKNDTNPLTTSLSTTVSEAPKYGNLTLNSDGSFTYAHDHSEYAEDRFVYTVSNDHATTQATVILTVTPVDDAPSITKLELAQTHLIPAEGKSWAGDKFTKYNLHLVGNRDALVLVDIAAANSRVVDAVVEAYVAGQKLGEVTLNSPDTLPKTEANGPAYSTTAYWAKLEKSWIKPGLELRVRANEGQFSENKAVKVGAPTEFTMYTLPFYLFGLDETDIPLSQTAAPDKTTQDEYFAKHPFATLNMLNHPAGKIVWPYIIVGPRQGRVAQKVEYKEQQGDGYAVMGATLNTLGAIRSANGDNPTNNQYYAPLLMANQAGSYSGPGGGLGGGHVGTGDYSYTGIFIHEAGHAFGMPHANDSYTSGTYPYIGGSVKGSSWGFDQINNTFLGTFVPTNASTFARCATSGFPMGRQFDEQNRCVKQDPMQSGSGDEAKGYKYTMFSDFNASVVQQYLEGTTTENSGTHTYNGGRVFVDKTSSTGYSRWDSIDNKFVPVEVKTIDGGLYGLDNGLPVQRDVSVQTIIVTIGIDSVQDTATEVTGETHLTYQDTITYNNTITQIYPPISYTGNLRRVIDPTDATQRASIVPDTGENYWYCRNSGCDYTLKVTFSDNSEQYVAIQGGFKGWFSNDIKANAGTPTNSDSYRIFGVNVSGNKTIKKLELLETPEVWKGLPAVPKVIATRTLN
jgi:VCBS repeat-containing protein